MAAPYAGAAAGGVAMKARRRKTRTVQRRKEPTEARRRGSSAADLQKQLDQHDRKSGWAVRMRFGREPRSRTRSL